MSGVSWQKGPLGLEIERCVGEKGTGQGYTRAYANWIRMHLMNTSIPPHPKLSELNAKLSTSQANSYGLLLEWWSAKCQEEHLSRRMTLAIETAAGLGNISESDIQDAKILEFVRRKPTADALPFDIGLGQNLYNDAMFKLFLQEFFYYEDVDSMAVQSLQFQRQKCAALAMNQRIAFSCLKSALEEQIDRPIVGEVAMESPADGSIPHASQQQSRRELGASIETCPWLNLCKEKGGSGDLGNDSLPFFLWDRSQKRTVKVSDLVDRPEYVVVSHTWGRWIQRTEDNHDAPPVSIPGVPDWKVPPNTKFKVQDLPNILQQIPFQVPYIWMDLLCIPQKPSDPGLTTIAQNEIARQAEIFHWAAGGAVWFNDVASWDGLERTIEWLALNFFIASDNAYQKFEEFREAAFDYADVPTGFYYNLEPSTVESTEAAEFLGWFSSLWTLQEAFLKSGMFLLNKDCQVLSVGETPVLVTLEALAALLEGFTDIAMKGLPERADTGSRLALEQEFQDMDFPQGYVELSKLFWDTGMDQLLNASPITPLILGNERYCKSSRAQAIMSVIGTTEWYQDAVKQFDDTPEDDLVLGKFPLQFLQEIQRKHGAMLFSSFAIGLEGPPRTGSSTIGSLLPFTSESANRSLNRFRNRWQMFDISDHASIQGWQIRQDGSVMLPEVCLTASTDQHDVLERIPASVMVPLIHDGEKEASLHRTADLRAWLSSYAANHVAHAICLFHGLNYVEGVILVGVAERFKTFTKVGNFFVTDTGEFGSPNSQRVDWLVL